MNRTQTTPHGPGRRRDGPVATVHRRAHRPLAGILSSARVAASCGSDTARSGLRGTSSIVLAVAVAGNGAS